MMVDGLMGKWVGVMDGQAWKKNCMGMGDGDCGLC
jgi:hypothetical protein